MCVGFYSWVYPLQCCSYAYLFGLIGLDTSPGFLTRIPGIKFRSSCACKVSILIVISLPSSITQMKQENTERQKDGGSPLRDRTIVHTFTSCSSDLLFHSIFSKAELLIKHYIYLHHSFLTCLSILLFPADSILILVSGDRQPFIMRHHYTM